MLSRRSRPPPRRKHEREAAPISRMAGLHPAPLGELLDVGGAAVSLERADRVCGAAALSAAALPEAGAAGFACPTVRRRGRRVRASRRARRGCGRRVGGGRRGTRTGAVPQHPPDAGAALMAAQYGSAREQLDTRHSEQANQENQRGGTGEQRESRAPRWPYGSDRSGGASARSRSLGGNHLRHVGGKHLGHLGGPAVGQPHPRHHDLAGAVERPFVGHGRHRRDHRSDSRPDDGAVRAEDGSGHRARGRGPGSGNDLADGQACLRRAAAGDGGGTFRNDEGMTPPIVGPRAGRL